MVFICDIERKRNFNLQICNVDRKRVKGKTSTKLRPFRQVEKVKLVSYTVER